MWYLDSRIVRAGKEVCELDVDGERKHRLSLWE